MTTKPCPSCDGTGYWVDNHHGHYGSPCRNCQGTGLVQIGDEFGDTGEVCCPTCKGKGTVQR